MIYIYDYMILLYDWNNVCINNSNGETVFYQKQFTHCRFSSIRRYRDQRIILLIQMN